MARANRKVKNYKFYDNYNYYIPGIGGMFGLLAFLLLGALLGNVFVIVFQFALGADAAMTYGMLVSYPVMFIPAMLYASSKSRVASMDNEGVKLDSDNFGSVGFLGCAGLVMLATLACSLVSEPVGMLLPEAPEWFDALMENMTTEGSLLVNFISVSLFAPFFEEWLCRGMVLRGLLNSGKVKPVWAVVISAAFFALIHANPWQAVPAFLLGSLFGFIYYRTGSLKLTMLMHFTNNTFALVLSNVDSLAEIETFRDLMPGPLYWIVAAACLLLLVLIIRVFLRIPTARPSGNCDIVPSIFGSEI